MIIALHWRSFSEDSYQASFWEHLDPDPRDLLWRWFLEQPKPNVEVYIMQYDIPNQNLNLKYYGEADNWRISFAWDSIMNLLHPRKWLTPSIVIGDVLMTILTILKWQARPRWASCYSEMYIHSCRNLQSPHCWLYDSIKLDFLIYSYVETTPADNLTSDLILSERTSVRWI